MRRKLSLIAGAFTLTLGSVFLAASPAQAHTVCAEFKTSGGTLRASACMYDAHHWATVCDRRSDNIGPVLKLWSNLGYNEVRDPDGNGGSCGGRHSVANETYTSWELCWNGTCSARIGA
jgi:hypothetical protein